VVDLTPLQIRDIDEARRFYHEVLGCVERPEADQRLDFNLHGHRIVCCLNPKLGKQSRVVSHYHLVDGKYVPIAHCSVVLEMSKWRSLAKKLKQQKVKFVIEPSRHIKGAPGVQAMLFLDPSGNALEVQSLYNSVEGCLRCERQRGLARWMRWAVLTAFVVCCILLLLRKSADEIATGHFPESTPPSSCASTGSCAP
jgi:uncharacterized protein